MRGHDRALADVGIEHLVDLEAGTYTGKSHGHARPHGSARAVQPGRPRVVRHELRGPDRGAGRGLGGHRARRAHADPRADGEWQDPRCVPVRASTDSFETPARRPPARTRATSASCTSARSRPSPTTSSATSAHRSPGSRSRPPASARPSHTSRSRAGPATRPGGSPRDRPPPAGHPHHDARIALPDAHQRRARGPPQGRARDRRRGPRDRGQQARRAPRVEPRAPRAPSGGGHELAPAHRPQRDAAPARDDRPVPGRHRRRTAK